mmetsp:Transcript_6046/g.15437  ORF Transcript_6046/g.15437 Transcript_6046/m.15437 type:complete len:442 (-) Transcript_6046:77-1402(-)
MGCSNSKRGLALPLAQEAPGAAVAATAAAAGAASDPPRQTDRTGKPGLTLDLAALDDEPGRDAGQVVRCVEEDIAEATPVKRKSIESLASQGRLVDSYLVSTRVLGQGQFAVVKPCLNLKTGKKCAVKMVNVQRSSKERLVLEVEILRRLKGHPNIVGLYDVYVTHSEVQLVMELIVGGELFDHLVQSGPYSEAAAAYHMRRIVSAVEFLHRNEIVHRDLKPENLLLTSKDPKFAEVKVADFGLARLCERDAMLTVCGTWAYCAPEVRNDENGYGAKVDVWSLGVILFVLLAAYHPFDKYGQADEDAMWHRAEACKFDFDDEAWDGVSDDARDLIRQMICLDPKERLSAEDVLSHPWLTGSAHGLAPLSPRINIDLDTVRTRYRRKVAGAGKAAWASMAFARTLRQSSSRTSGSEAVSDVEGSLEEVKAADIEDVALLTMS